MACVSGTGAGSGGALCAGWQDPYRGGSGFGKDYAFKEHIKPVFDKERQRGV